jgi:hypothetical protein
MLKDNYSYKPVNYPGLGWDDGFVNGGGTGLGCEGYDGLGSGYGGGPLWEPRYGDGRGSGAGIGSGFPDGKGSGCGRGRCSYSRYKLIPPSYAYMLHYACEAPYVIRFSTIDIRLSRV